MTTMDLKGIAWAGDVYLKFEARLLEVEEIMYEAAEFKWPVRAVKFPPKLQLLRCCCFGQEVVKYVENRMQTVSNNVRKFYSDVMQDFPVDSGADVGMEEKCGKADDSEKLTEDMKMTTDSGSDRHPLGRRITVRRILRQHSKRSLSNKSNLDIDKNSNCNNVSPKETSGITTPSSKYLIRYSSNAELSDQNLEASCDQTARLTTPGCVETENESENMPEISFYKPSLDMVVNITETGRHEGTDSRPSCSNLLEESNAGVYLLTWTSKYAIQESGFPRIQKIFFVANGNKQTHKFAYEEDSVSNSESEEDGAIIDEGMEIIRVDKASFEEICVLVTGDEFHHVPREGQNWPYKKIRDIFCSRKRSLMKEYEQLALQCSSDSKSKQEESVFFRLKVCLLNFRFIDFWLWFMDNVYSSGCNSLIYVLCLSNELLM
ncbi:NADPH dehydrogenase [Salix suchowensis]|nr:NADPH dehydrogenase [Salix suchowensis]